MLAGKGHEDYQEIKGVKYPMDERDLIADILKERGISFLKKEFANVIVDISHEKVDRPFGYRIPERLADSVTPGVRVKIPFGAGNALRTGYVIEVTDHSEFPRERMKEIDSVIPGTKEPSQRLIVLAAWMKQQYGSTMIQALKTVLPARATVGEKRAKKH